VGSSNVRRVLKSLSIQPDFHLCEHEDLTKKDPVFDGSFVSGRPSADGAYILQQSVLCSNLWLKCIGV
jgi:hypothetical protein